MKRIYTASKLSSAPMWQQLQRDWGTSVFFHARWLRHVEAGTPDTPEFAVRFWVEDQEDVQTADAVLVYANGVENLRGALVEAGIAIERRIPVIVVGESPCYGTWQYHPGVQRAADFDHALLLLNALS